MNTTTQHTQRPVEAKRRAAIAGVLALLLGNILCRFILYFSVFLISISKNNNLMEI